jgi:hypothetical protein
MALIFLSILFICYGSIISILRVVAPNRLKKYIYMRDKYGPRLGFIIHFISYTALPIMLGLLLLTKVLLNN